MKLLLHPVVEAKVASIIANPGGTVLLHGVKGVGKRTIAKEIGRQLNCLGCKNEDCRTCRMVQGGNHPDVIMVSPDAKHKIGIEQVHQLQHDLQYARYEPAGNRVVVIHRAQLLTLPAQHALLKLLEEPPEGTTLILTSEALEALLPTVVSRCRSVYVPRIKDTTLTEYLNSLDSSQANKIATIVALSEGAIGVALAFWSQPELLHKHQQLMTEVQNFLEVEDFFEKLRIASFMGASDNVKDYVIALAVAMRRFARQGKSQMALGALERLQQRLNANVSSKAAFEALAVELA